MGDREIAFVDGDIDGGQPAGGFHRHIGAVKEAPLHGSQVIFFDGKKQALRRRGEIFSSEGKFASGDNYPKNKNRQEHPERDDHVSHILKLPPERSGEVPRHAPIGPKEDL